MTDLGRVLILAGGLSPEREVSLHSGGKLRDALARIGVEAELADVDAATLPALAADPPDVVFPVLHGTSGEDGTIREVLDLYDLPYVGALPPACRVAFDKATAKAAVAAAGVATPAAVTLPREAFHDLGAAALIERIVARLGLPVVVKPRAGGSAFGVTRVEDAGELAEALMSCFGYHDSALIEQAVAGVEIAIGVVDTGEGPVALPAVEIEPRAGVYDYAARYTAGATSFFTPARLSEEILRAAAETALTAHRVLGLRDLSRTDLIVDGNGVAQFLEVNVAPGMTDTSTWPMGLHAAGLDFAVVCRDLAAHAYDRRDAARG
ncbi:D-alanine--D-alanine ligase [Frankia sp. B2]|uniref:D-alanine--D-alanine ligase family protein n=1 Tax=Frankia TaxID=1854 RepID=UPI0003CFABF6|nr:MULTISPECIES: D-alanine--D-alanine ligase [Frankia]ESZ99950.1 D-alanine--D-alanine ligase [Frankia sp. CcI6]KDA41356.1 D-alanine--D-alanine ligase [Frankia sp. BMG5.23]KFB02700.1 D-alanine--D-alanine ligase [Frankia sp. Allo2]OAA18584.1 D-alanine--D-alanine ligase [Frankia casuarinae]OHV49259.1 D-alanine--D-alanine ligase [Frankia sp. CgIS1]